MEKILISACLLGDKTKYDGGDNYWPFVEKLKKRYILVPFCPEVEGGLTVPREPCEIQQDGTVKTVSGKDVTKAFRDGAEKAANAASFFGASIAILKDGSPSCGSRYVYDGTFKHNKIEGLGMAARRLIAAGIRVYSSEDNLDFLLEDERKRDFKRDGYKKEGFRKGGDFERKPYAQRSESNLAPADGQQSEVSTAVPTSETGEKPFRRSSYGHKPYRSSSSGYGKRPYRSEGRSSFHRDGERKPYRSFRRSEDGFEKRPYRSERPEGERTEGSSFKKPYVRKSFGSKPYGERRSYGSRDYGEKKPYAKRPYGERKPYGHKDGEGFEKRPYGDRKPYGEKRYGASRDGYKKRDGYAPKKRFSSYSKGPRKFASKRPYSSTPKKKDE